MCWLAYEYDEHDNSCLVDFAIKGAFDLELWLAHLDGPFWTYMRTEALIVDYLVTCRFHLKCRTALRVSRHLRKSLHYSNGYLLSVHCHALVTYLVVSILLSSG